MDLIDSPPTPALSPARDHTDDGNVPSPHTKSPIETAAKYHVPADAPKESAVQTAAPGTYGEEWFISLEKRVADLERSRLKALRGSIYNSIAKRKASKYVEDFNICLFSAISHSLVTCLWIFIVIPGIPWRGVPVGLTNTSTPGGADPLASITYDASRTQKILSTSLAATLFAILIAVFGREWILYHIQGASLDEERRAELTGLKEWVMGSSLMLRLGFILHAAALIVYLRDLDTFSEKVEPESINWRALYVIVCIISFIAHSVWAACTYHVDHCFFARLFLGLSP